VLGAALLIAALAWVYRPALMGELIAGRDAFRFFFPAYHFLLECLRRGELPLWNPYLRLGQPFAASLIAQAFYPPAWLCAGLLGAVRGYTLQQILHAAIAAAGAYALCRRLRCSRPASIAASAAFALSPLLTDLSGHRNAVDAAAWTGLLLWAALELVRRPSAWSAARLAAFAALAFLAGSPETNLWQAALAALAVLWSAPSRRAVAFAGIAAVWAAALCGLELLPAIELARHSVRGTSLGDPLEWSASPIQLAALFWPFADLPRGEYWGKDQWWLFTLFVSSTSALQAAFALRRSRRVLPFAAGGAAFALLALGREFPPSAWILSHPPLNAFRYPAKYLLGAAFCLAVLSAFGLDRLALLSRRRGPRPLVAAALVLAAFVLLGIGGPLLHALGARSGAAKGFPWLVGAWALAGLAVALVPGGARRPRRLRWALCALALLELAAYHGLQPGFGWVRPGRLDQPSSLAAAIPRGYGGRISLAITDAPVEDPSGASFIDRSRDALVPNRSMEEGLRALEGYGAPEPEGMDEFQLAGRRGVFDLAGVGYYLRAGPPPYPDLVRISGGPPLPSLYASATALPRAFVVHRAVRATDAEAVAAAWSDAEPARATAFLADGEPLEVSCAAAAAPSRARITSDLANDVEVEVTSCGDGYLVLSDSYFPGWRAEVDGAPAEIHRADFALRAVRMGAGTHRVSFRYRPRAFGIGGALSAAGLVALIAAAL